MRSDSLVPIRASILVCALLTSVAGGATNAQDASDLEGTWIGQWSEVESAKREFKPGEVRMIFKGSQIWATGIVAHDEKVLGFSTNTTTRPRQLDYWQGEGQKTQCVYEVVGDTLRIGVPRGSGGRPSAVVSGQGIPTVILVLKRQ